MNKNDELLLEALQLLAESRQFSGQMGYSVRSMNHNRRVVVVHCSKPKHLPHPSNEEGSRR